MTQLKEENERIEADAERLVRELETTTSDAARLLDERQRDLDRKVAQEAEAEVKVAEVEADLAARAVVLEALREQARANEATLAEGRQARAEKRQLEDRQREVEARAHKHRDALDALDAELEDLGSQAAEQRARLAELRVRAGSFAELRILFGEVWEVSITHSVARGPAPRHRDFNSLCSLEGGGTLVHYGGTPWESGRDMAVLRVEADGSGCTWDDPETGPSARVISGAGAESGHQEFEMALPRAGHTATALRPACMLVVGGREPSAGGDGDGTLVPGVASLDLDAPSWDEPQTMGHPLPPRVGHACATDRDSHLFLFGGRAQLPGGDQALMSDLWRLDHAGAPETWTWRQLTGLAGTPPLPKWGASIAVVEDGTRLCIYGGHDDAGSVGDLHLLNLHTGTWRSLGVGVGTPPRPRHGHIATICGRYMVITGGGHQPRVADDSAGAAATPVEACSDTWVLDLETYAWECLHDAGPPPPGTVARPHSCLSAAAGRRILTLRPSPTDSGGTGSSESAAPCLSLLEVLEFKRPQDIEAERLRGQVGGDLVTELALSTRAEVSSSAIIVSWRVPTKNADRLLRFCLKMGTSTGVVREVYRGREPRFKAGGLRSACEYVFCVKAEYNDGSELWSEPVSFITRL